MAHRSALEAWLVDPTQLTMATHHVTLVRSHSLAVCQCHGVLPPAMFVSELAGPSLAHSGLKVGSPELTLK